MYSRSKIKILETNPSKIFEAKKICKYLPESTCEASLLSFFSLAAKSFDDLKNQAYMNVILLSALVHGEMLFHNHSP